MARLSNASRRKSRTVLCFHRRNDIFFDEDQPSRRQIDKYDLSARLSHLSAGDKRKMSHVGSSIVVAVLSEHISNMYMNILSQFFSTSIFCWSRMPSTVSGAEVILKVHLLLLEKEINSEPRRHINKGQSVNLLTWAPGFKHKLIFLFSHWIFYFLLMFSLPYSFPVLFVLSWPTLCVIFE